MTQDSELGVEDEFGHQREGSLASASDHNSEDDLQSAINSLAQGRKVCNTFRYPDYKLYYVCAGITQGYSK